MFGGLNRWGFLDWYEEVQPAIKLLRTYPEKDVGPLKINGKPISKDDACTFFMWAASKYPVDADDLELAFRLARGAHYNREHGYLMGRPTRKQYRVDPDLYSDEFRRYCEANGRPYSDEEWAQHVADLKQDEKDMRTKYAKYR
jgi:hypothetical protein